MREYLGILAFTWRRVKGVDDSAIKKHLLFLNNSPNLKISQCSLPTTITLSYLNEESSNQ